MYVQLDEDYYGHPKTALLMKLIGPEGDTYPPRLWTWALKYAKKGIMRSDATIELACRWVGAPGLLSEALKEAGFVDRDPLAIHNWMSRTGRDIERYEAKKKRLQERRTGTVPEHSGNVSGLSGNVPPKRRGEERRGSDLSGADLNGTDLSGEDIQPSTTLSMLLKLARKAKIAAKAETLRTYIEAWIARSNAGRVEQILMDPWTPGRTVIEIQDRFFSGDNGGGSWNDLLGGKE